MSNSETYMKINDCKIFPEKLLARRVCDDFWWIVVPSADAVPSQHACSQLAEIQRSVHTAQSWVDQRRSESHPARNVVADINIHEHTTPVHFFQILKRKFENKLHLLRTSTLQLLFIGVGHCTGSLTTVYPLYILCISVHTAPKMCTMCQVVTCTSRY